MKVKFTVKNALCPSLPFAAYGVYDCDFNFCSHEWSCSNEAGGKASVVSRDTVEAPTQGNIHWGVFLVSLEERVRCKLLKTTCELSPFASCVR